MLNISTANKAHSIAASLITQVNNLFSTIETALQNGLDGVHSLEIKAALGEEILTKLLAAKTALETSAQTQAAVEPVKPAQEETPVAG